jgi:membrane protease YdiL (CAAX protease family)
LAVLAVLPTRLRAQVGVFRIPQRSAWLPLIAITSAVCALSFARTAFFGTSTPLQIETIAFQATMPGLHEELAFRGVWWVLLALALDPGQINEGKIPRWTLFATTLLFGAVHAIDLTPQGELAINWLFFGATAMSGLLYGLLQGIGRAIWIPVIVHNLANTIIYGWQMSMP